MLKLDLHVHSKYSPDCLMEPWKIARVARERGLDGIAVVDHDTIKGGLITRRDCRNSLNVIVGSEVCTNAGDIIGLFLNEEITSSDALEVINDIERQGGISILPHPFKGHKYSGGTFDEICRKVDMIEGINSRSPISAQMFNRLKALNKTLVAGSDAHFLSEIGLSRTIVLNDAAELENIKKAILTGNIKIQGTMGPTCLQSMSQVIKGIKTRKCIDILFSSALLPLSIVRDAHKRSSLPVESASQRR